MPGSRPKNLPEAICKKAVRPYGPILLFKDKKNPDKSEKFVTKKGNSVRK